MSNKKSVSSVGQKLSAEFKFLTDTQADGQERKQYNPNFWRFTSKQLYHTKPTLYHADGKNNQML